MRCTRPQHLLRSNSLWMGAGRKHPASGFCVYLKRCRPSCVLSLLFFDVLSSPCCRFLWCRWRNLVWGGFLQRWTLTCFPFSEVLMRLGVWTEKPPGCWDQSSCSGSLVNNVCIYFLIVENVLQQIWRVDVLLYQDVQFLQLCITFSSIQMLCSCISPHLLATNHFCLFTDERRVDTEQRGFMGGFSLCNMMSSCCWFVFHAHFKRSFSILWKHEFTMTVCSVPGSFLCGRSCGSHSLCVRCVDVVEITAGRLNVSQPEDIHCKTAQSQNHCRTRPLHKLDKRCSDSFLCQTKLLLFWFLPWFNVSPPPPPAPLWILLSTAPEGKWQLKGFWCWNVVIINT